MKNIARRLMSGASFAVLAIGALPAQTARASAGRFITSTVPSVHVAGGSTPDFIWVASDGNVTPGGITNDGDIGPGPLPWGIAILPTTASDPAIVHGDILN